MQGEKLEVGLPEKIDLRLNGSNLEITRRWFGGKFIFLTAFVIFWDGFLIIWYSKAMSIGSLMPLLFPLLFVCIGIYLTYYVIAGCLNKTFIKVDYSNISIRHKPIPFWGNKTIRSSDVKQLYSKESPIRKAGPYGLSYEGAPPWSYEVHVLTHNGKDIKLLSGLDSSEQALYIEQEIEKYLNIEDKPIIRQPPYLS